MSEAYQIRWQFSLTVDSNSYVWYSHGLPGVLRCSDVVISNNYNGIRRIHTFSDYRFTVKDEGYTIDDFIGGRLWLFLQIYENSSLYGRKVFKGTVIKVEKNYGEVTLTIRDRMKCALEEMAPEGKLVSDIWPNVSRTDLAVPTTFGVAYIDAPCILDDSSTPDKYYLLGFEPIDSADSYTIEQVQAPEQYGAAVWTCDDMSAGEYSCPQTTLTVDSINYIVFQGLIHDSDGDSIPDSNLLFPYSGTNLPFTTKYSNSDTVASTNPANVMADILFGFTRGSCETAIWYDTVGISSAKSTYTTWGLTFNGAINRRASRKKYFESMLIQAASFAVHLYSGTSNVKGYALQPFSKASQDTFDSSNIVQDSFEYQNIKDYKNNFDGGYIAIPNAGESQEKLYKYAVPLDGVSSVDNPTDTTLEMPYLQDPDDAYRAGVLHYQRELDKIAKIKFKTHPKLVISSSRYPDQVITIDGTDYGADSESLPYDAVIQSITFSFTNDLTTIEAIRYGHDLDDWADITPGTLAVASSSDLNAYSRVSAGPVVAVSSGTAPNKHEGGFQVEWIRAYGSAGLRLGDDSGQGPLINDGGALTNAYQPAFLVGLSATQLNIPANSGVTIHYNNEKYDQGNDFNTTTYTFTASVDGKYHFDILIHLLNVDTAATYYRILLGTTINSIYKYEYDLVSTMHLTYSIDVEMNANDTAYVSIYQSGGSSQTDISTISTYFSGHLVA